MITKRIRKALRWKSTNANNNVCTPLPARKGTIPASCGMPSFPYAKKQISGTFPWYLHPKTKKENKQRGTINRVVRTTTKNAIKRNK